MSVALSVAVILNLYAKLGRQAGQRINKSMKSLKKDDEKSSSPHIRFWQKFIAIQSISYLILRLAKLAEMYIFVQ